MMVMIAQGRKPKSTSVPELSGIELFRLLREQKPRWMMTNEKQNLQGARAFMEAGKIYKLPGHKSCATDLDLWKQAKEWPADGGFTKVLVYKCPLAGRF